jgi:putative membrane protein
MGYNLPVVPAAGSESIQRRPPERPPVDSRLLQANERTLLAWLRTGIALMTFGFVLARIGVWLHAIVASPAPGFGTAWMGGAFVALGVVASGAAVRRFVCARTAILAGKEIVTGRFPVIFGVAVTLLGALLSAFVLFRLR